MSDVKQNDEKKKAKKQKSRDAKNSQTAFPTYAELNQNDFNEYF